MVEKYYLFHVILNKGSVFLLRGVILDQQVSDSGLSVVWRGGGGGERSVWESMLKTGSRGMWRNL